MTFGEAVDPAVKFAPGLVSVSEAGDPEVKFAPGLVSQACLGCICKVIGMIFIITNIITSNTVNKQT